MKLPNVWLKTPDEFETGNIDYKIKILEIKEITEVAWSTNSGRKPMEKLFRETGKLPLCLVENIKGRYELHDGQHRFAAYRNVFPNMKWIKVAIFAKKEL